MQQPLKRALIGAFATLPRLSRRRYSSFFSKTVEVFEIE